MVLYLEYPGKTDGWCSGRQGGAAEKAAFFVFIFCLKAARLSLETALRPRGLYRLGRSLAIILFVQPVLSSNQMREVDRLTVESFQTPSLLLMEAAANACLRAIENQFNTDLSGKKALVLCGKGNNGGDGAALARALTRCAVYCDVVLCGHLSETKGDARTNFEATRALASFNAGSASVPAPLTFIECPDVSTWEQIAPTRKNYDIIVDALFGTGLTRPLEGLTVKVVEHLAMLKRARDRVGGVRPLLLSVDVPSGLDADSANPIGQAVNADITVTFTAPKPANVLPPASHYCGKLFVADIGSPRSLIDSVNPTLFVTESEDVKQWLISTRYRPESHKNTHGHVLIVAGSRGYTGAAALCGSAAIRSGAGLVTIATPNSVQDSVASSAMPEIMTMALAETDRGTVSEDAIEHLLERSSKASVIAVGPGLTSEDERTRHFVREIVTRRSKPMVVDADGLNCLSPWPSTILGSPDLPLILTPHPGEMRRLSGRDALGNDRVSIARDFAVANNLIIVLKGSRSIIADPDGRVFVNPTGNPGLGTAGSGDTLTGLIAGFLSQAYASLTQPDPLSATLAALYVGGLAGDLAASELGMRSMVASDVRERFGRAIRELDLEGERP